MGFFKKHTSSYPARRNRMNEHPATVNPPSEYGVHNPQAMPASVYQANGTPVAPSAVAAVAAPATASTYNASAYGGFPADSAPVQATAYVPGRATAMGASPAVVTAAPIQATAYSGVEVVAPPTTAPYNPLYQTGTSFNNGNANYNTDESSFWECSICTFPNLRTEAACKGCGSPIPPGLLMSAAAAAVAMQGPPQDDYGAYRMGQMNAQMDGLSLGGTGAAAGAAPSSSSSAAGGSSGVMRVPIPAGMRPGQKIKVRSPDGNMVVKAIPPECEWHYDDIAKPFFRMQFGPPAGDAGGAPGTLMAHEVPPAHTTAWRDFHSRAPTAFSPPPLGTRTAPHTPIGSGTGIPPNGRHKALIIGINYHGTRARLSGCINDAKSMQTLLQRNGFPNDGSHMLLLTDERNRGHEYQPTVDNIMKAFHWFMKDVRRGDVLFFHFSGHGGQVPDKTGHEVDGFNETIIPLDHDRKGQITDDVLWGSLVFRLPEGARITALMDMCHSGTGLDLPYDYNVNTKRWTEDINPAHSKGDVVLFSGCEDSQTSADIGGGFGQLAGGAMTQAFVGAYEARPSSTYHEFLSEVKKNLKQKRFSQRPQLTSSQKFDADGRIFSLGYGSGGMGGAPSIIEPNHNPKIGRHLKRRVRPARNSRQAQEAFGLAGAAAIGYLVAEALF